MGPIEPPSLKVEDAKEHGPEQRGSTSSTGRKRVWAYSHFVGLKNKVMTGIPYWLADASGAVRNASCVFRVHPSVYSPTFVRSAGRFLKLHA